MSEPYPTRRLPERNPLTYQEHRRQVLWQIALPLGIGAFVVLILAVLTILASMETISRWADISLIFLIIVLAVVTLLFIAVSGALVYGVWYTLKYVPPYARIAQDFLETVRQRTRQGADLAVEPILRINGWVASLRALRRKPQDSK